MALNIPRQVASLLVGDEATNRALAGLGRAIQPLLDFANSTFSVAQNSALNIVRDVVTQALTVNGQATVNGAANVKGPLSALSASINGDVTINNGNVVIRTRKGNGVVIVPSGGSPTFYCTNPANTDAVFLVDAVGNTSAVSFSSRQGFKSWVSLGSYWNTNTASSDQYFTMTPIIRAGTATPAYIQRRWVPTRSGSIMGVSVWCNNTIVVNQNWTVQRNGANIIGVLVPANTYYAIPTFAKGAVPFSAGDAITCFVTVGTGQNFAATVEIEIEEGA